MAFPPQFSSTATYANRYDLDEIDVFLEGDSSSPMFFNINGLPSNLSFGKHYFYLSTLNPSFPNNQYLLRQNSKILFEFKSINNVILKSDIVETNQKNGVITGFVEVLQNPLRTFKEIQDGDGTFTIVATLAEKLDNNGTPTVYQIPNNFKNTINYRCTFPINVRKNLINADSPTLTSIKHEIKTITGQFSFKKNNISTPPSVADNGGGINYNQAGIPLGNLSGGDSESAD